MGHAADFLTLPPKRARRTSNGMPIIATDVPILYEDEGQEEMGETLPHSTSVSIVQLGLSSHLAGRAGFRVISDMNLFYSPLDRKAYISPDVMVVKTIKPLPEHLRSYRISKTRPAPLVVVEVLSRRSFQQQDLTNKPDVCAELGVREYILVDVTGEYLPAKLQLWKLRSNGNWIKGQDPDGAITSKLGFRIVIDREERLRVLDAATGRRYLRPDEVETQIRKLEAELDRLRVMNRKAK